MSLYFRWIALVGIMLSVSGLCFSCWEDSDRDVTRLASVQYKNFTFFPQTHQFDGLFWSEVNQIQKGLKTHIHNQMIITNRSIVTSIESLLTNEVVNSKMIRKTLQTFMERQEKLEKILQEISDIKPILNNLFYLITVNPDLFVVMGVRKDSSGLDSGSLSFSLASTFDKLIKKCKKSSLVAINVDDFKKCLFSMMEFLKVTILRGSNGKKKSVEDEPLFTLPLASAQEMERFYHTLITQIGSFQQEIRDGQALKRQRSFFRCF